MKRESRTKLVFVWMALAISCTILQNVAAEESVYWETVYYPREARLDVTVFSSMPLCNVRCEIILVDESNKVVDKRQLQISQDKTDIVPKDKRATTTLKFDAKGASISYESLLFAEPILSSPKATVPATVAGVKKGITALSHQRM